MTVTPNSGYIVVVDTKGHEQLAEISPGDGRYATLRDLRDVVDTLDELTRDVGDYAWVIARLQQNRLIGVSIAEDGEVVVSQGTAPNHVFSDPKDVAALRAVFGLRPWGET